LHNKALGSKYGVSSYPTIKFFGKNSKDEPELYEGPRTREAFVEFLNDRCGTHRSVGGGLNQWVSAPFTLSMFEALICSSRLGDLSIWTLWRLNSLLLLEGLEMPLLKKLSQPVRRPNITRVLCRRLLRDLRNTSKKRPSGTCSSADIEYDLGSFASTNRLKSIVEKRTLLADKLDEIQIKLNILSAFREHDDKAKFERSTAEL
jgi:hypothetical protein